MTEPEVCWHCQCVLMREPAPHCDQCPPFGECDELGCDEPGCSEALFGDDDLPTDPTERARYVEHLGSCDLQTQLTRCRELLRRVIDDGLDPAALRALARDIARELGAPDPFAQN